MSPLHWTHVTPVENHYLTCSTSYAVGGLFFSIRRESQRNLAKFPRHRVPREHRPTSVLPPNNPRHGYMRLRRPAHDRTPFCMYHRTVYKRRDRQTGDKTGTGKGMESVCLSIMNGISSEQYRFGRSTFGSLFV